MFISHLFILHPHFAPGGRGQKPPLERKAGGGEIAERKRGKSDHTLPAKLTANPAEEGEESQPTGGILSLNWYLWFWIKTLTVTCNGYGTFYYLKTARKGTRYLSFYSGAEEKIPTLSKLRGMDGDKNNVALVITAHETCLLNLLVTHLAETRASVTDPCMNSRTRHIHLPERCGKQDFNQCSSTLTNIVNHRGDFKSYKNKKSHGIWITTTCPSFIPAPFLKPRSTWRTPPLVVS